MKGKIKAYSEVVSAGVITGDNGKTYNFTLHDWRGEHLPQDAEVVHFSGHSRTATNVEDQK